MRAATLPLSSSIAARRAHYPSRLQGMNDIVSGEVELVSVVGYLGYDMHRILL